jgi:TolB-like protein/DNA-binding winged helix-turn-helix (wHTH) protein/Tfp pilus assembly protein PilF
MDLLIVLVQRRQQLVSRSEIAALLWGEDVFVEIETGINTAVRKIRQALRDPANAPVFIETMPGKGYRFIAPVEVLPREPEPAAEVLSPERPIPVGTQTTTDRTAVTRRDGGNTALWRLGLPLLALVAVVTIGFAAWARGRTSDVVPLDSLVILPFVNATGDDQLDYLGDGLAEMLINHFSQVDGLRVVPRATVFEYRGNMQDPAAVAKKFRVQAVATGKVMLHGKSLTIQADLIEVARDAQLWGEQYQREMGDLPTIQQDIVHAISRAMRLRLRPEERARLARAVTTDSVAHRLYLRGLYHLNKSTPADSDRALENFGAAIGRDERFALAHTGVAMTHYVRVVGMGMASPQEAMPVALTSLERALALDPNLAEAYTTRGVIRLTFDWNIAAAERDLRRALELNPHLPLARGNWGLWLMSQRRSDEAVAEVEKQVEQDPLSLQGNTDLAATYLSTGRLTEALGQLDKTLELDDYPRAHFIRFLALRAAGRFDEAFHEWIKTRRLTGSDEAATRTLERAFQEGGIARASRVHLDFLIERSRSTYVSPMVIAYAAANAGDVDVAFEYLERAYQIRQGDMAGLHHNPRLAQLRDDPRFLDLLRRVGVDPQVRR